MAYGDYGTYNGGGGYASQADRHLEVDLKCPNCMGERDIDVNNMYLMYSLCISRRAIAVFFCG
ncbi:hypothetical protein [Ruminococcus albus]|uniref:Uncharacterized protein n=1 Tax=Ruminococcus albus (strain ATCC 27210 / DSM 20455 / JCM 14654 / NCDO 2250 / 7) TaxID=697329 RepID=E6UG26_RUMA7|nr:hypothetical protein [Ruminococcus albus]ADU21053.1 hypothetical protein Rumal_0500 [Ruminococcus albus 7 = DSM 20455]